ncbi:MAG: lipoyl domain-containing protein [Candidatus Bipolaricaulota bacterium]|nr:lipoyl domain-containing protein [Candidatus Bipolaricaulota bacterium]
MNDHEPNEMNLNEACLTETHLTEVRLPDLGEVDEVTIIAWLNEEGKPLRAGEDLVEVETEKTTFVIDAPRDGRLKRIVKKEGEKAHLNDLLAEIE